MGKLYRLWTEDYEPIGTWWGLPPAEEMIDGRNLTIDKGDFISKSRWSGRIVDGEPVHDYEFLEHILVWSNPCFGTEMDDNA